MPAVASSALTASEKGTIAVNFVNEALLVARQRGIGVDALLAEAGIAPRLLDVPQARVSAGQYAILWHGLTRVLDDEFFAMDSHGMKPGCFTLLGHATLDAPNLGRALTRALRFFGLVLDDLGGSLEVRDGRAELTLHQHRGPQRFFAHATFLLLLFGLACWLVGRRIPYQSVVFRDALPPGTEDEYRVFFGPSLSDGGPATVVAFDARYLTLPVVQNERTLKEFLREAPANLLVKYRNPRSLTARLRHRLRQTAPADWPDLERMARHLNMAGSTLRRHLEDEGQSYQSIKDELRRDLALDLLGHTSRSMLDVAMELGFAEASAFHRAFRKWTGTRPGEYRRRFQGGAGLGE